MTYKIETPKNFHKMLKKIPFDDLIKIRNRIRGLAENPKPNGIEKINDNLYRVRQGDYRILYNVHDDRLVVLIVDVDHGRQLYRDL